MAKRRAEAPDPAVKRTQDLFHDRFLARFGFKPDPRGYGRFGREVKPLLATWGEAAVRGLVEDFFRTRDARILASDYSMATFLFHAQRLRIRQVEAEVDPRTARNLDAADRAAGRRG